MTERGRIRKWGCRMTCRRESPNKREQKYMKILTEIDTLFPDSKPPLPIVTPPIVTPSIAPPKLDNPKPNSNPIEESKSAKPSGSISILSKWQERTSKMSESLKKFNANFERLNIGSFERDFKKEFRVILNKWGTEDIDNKIIEFSVKILEVVQKVDSDPSKTLAVLRILMDRLLAVTDNKPNPIAFKFYTGIVEIVNKKYSLFKEVMISYIFSQCKGISLLARPRTEFSNQKDYYVDRGYRYHSETIDGKKVEDRESLDKLFSERVGRYLQFLMYICNENTKFYSSFIWSYLQATLEHPINEFTPLIIKSILENSSENLMKIYNEKFKQLMLFIKTDFNEWERKMCGNAGSKTKNNDFCAKMHKFCEVDLKKFNKDDCSIVNAQIDQIEKCACKIMNGNFDFT